MIIIISRSEAPDRPPSKRNVFFTPTMPSSGSTWGQYYRGRTIKEALPWSHTWCKVRSELGSSGDERGKSGRAKQLCISDDDRPHRTYEWIPKLDFVSNRYLHANALFPSVSDSATTTIVTTQTTDRQQREKRKLYTEQGVKASK